MAAAPVTPGPGALLPQTQGREGPLPTLGVHEASRVLAGTSGCGLPWASPPRPSAALREASCVGVRGPVGG